jgi:hypothetical protein
MIPVLAFSPPLLPNPNPFGGALEVGITPAASGSSQNILAGSSVAGVRATYTDLNGLAAYNPALGIQTRNRGRKGIKRTARGIEDGTGRTK